MRDIYTSPRAENIDRVVALFARHGIATRITNRAVYDRPSYHRFSYGRGEDRSRWPHVEIAHAADLTRARALLREIGITPWVPHAELLVDARGHSSPATRTTTVRRVHTVALAALAAALVLLVLKMTGVT